MTDKERKGEKRQREERRNEVETEVNGGGDMMLKRH